MGSYLCKKKSDLLDPLPILSEFFQIKNHPKIWLTAKPEPDKIIFAFLTAVTRKPLAYIYIDTQEKMELYTVLDALDSFLFRSILNIRFFKKESLLYSRLKIAQEEESKNNDSDQSNDDSIIAKEHDFKMKGPNLDFINRKDDEEPLDSMKKQEDEEILYEYAETYYGGHSAYLSQNQIYCLTAEPE